MANGLHVDPQVVAHRNPIKSPDYQQLTPLDWVVLDFTDGRRTFEQLTSMLPANLSDLTASMIHLRLLGLLTWETPSNSTSSMKIGHTQPVMATAGSTISSLSGLDDARFLFLILPYLSQSFLVKYINYHRKVHLDLYKLILQVGKVYHV